MGRCQQEGPINSWKCPMNWQSGREDFAKVAQERRINSDLSFASVSLLLHVVCCMACGFFRVERFLDRLLVCLRKPSGSLASLTLSSSSFPSRSSPEPQSPKNCFGKELEPECLAPPYQQEATKCWESGLISREHLWGVAIISFSGPQKMFGSHI